MSRFSPSLGEDRTICIAHFMVCKSADSDGGLYIKLQLNSIVHRPVLHLPRYCFNIVTIPQITAGYTVGCGLFGEIACHI